METTSAVHRSVSPVRRPVAVSPQQHFKHTSPRDSKDMLRRLKRMARAAEVSYEHLPVRRRHTKLPPLASLSPYYSPPKAKTPVPPHFTVPLLSPMRSERGSMAPKPFLTKPTHLSYVEAINRDVDQVRDALRAEKNSLAYSVRFALQLTKYESSARLAICTEERSEANRLHRDFNQRRMVLTYVSTVRTPTPHQQMGDASMLEGNIIDAAGLHSLRVYRNTDSELKAAYGQTWRLPIVKAYERSHYDHPLPPSTTMDVLPHMLSYEGRLAMIREARWRRRIEEDEQGEWECMLGAFESLAAIYEELSRITQMVRANEAKREAKLRKRQQEIFYQLLTQSIVDRERSHRRHAVETMYGGFVASASLAIRHSKAKVAAYDAESAARRQLTEREEPRAWSHIEALAHESRQHALELIHYRLQAIENVLEPEQRHRAHVVEDESRCVLRLGAASFVALRCLEQQQLAVQEAVARSKLDLSNSLERVIIEEHFHRFTLAIFENHAFVQHCEAQHRSRTLLDEWLAWRVVVTHSSIELLELERQAEYSMLMRLEALELLLLESDLFRSETEVYEAESRNDVERGATTAMEDLLALQAAQSFAVPPDLGAGADLCSGMFDAELGADALDALRDEMDLTPTDHDLQHLVIPAILDDTRQRTFFLMMNPPEGTVYADERVAVGYRLTVRASEATVAVLVKNRSAVDAINGASITMINKPDGVELLGSSKNLGTLEPREVKQYKIKVKSVALILAGWPVAVLRFSIPAAAPFNPNRATKKTSKHYSVALPLPIGFTTFVQVRIPADIKGFGEFWKNMGKPNRTQELFKCSLVGATLEHAMELFMERINQLMKFHTICPNPHTLCFSGTYLVAGAQTPVCMVFRCVGNEEATILGVKIEARSSDRALERLVVAQAVMLMKADANLATLAKEPSTTELTTVASAPSFARKSSSATIEAPAATSSTTVAVAAPSTSSSSQLMSTSSSKNKFAPEANKKKKKKVTVVTQPAVATTVTS